MNIHRLGDVCVSDLHHSCCCWVVCTSPTAQECLERSVGVAAEARQGEVVNERVGGESQVDKVGQCSHDVDVRRLAQPFIQEKWKYR